MYELKDSVDLVREESVVSLWLVESLSAIYAPTLG
jgi:hypothetical protein